MHASVQKFVAQWSERLPVGQHVLEVGSADVNGSVRPTIVGTLVPASYLGVDLAPGPGVDLALPGGIETLGSEHDGKYGLVISTEMLEHAADWMSAVKTMRRCMSPGAWLLLTARGPGMHIHNVPDWWRFTCADFTQIARCLGLEMYECISDPQAPGVFMAARAPEWPSPARSGWNP